MNQLEEIVNYYLTSDTNYALMITGDWGVGKSFYFKNTLKGKIESTTTLKDGSKKYKFLLISLFGLKSVEEIQSEIFLSIYPLTKNSTVKLGVSIGRSLIKGIMSLTNLDKYYNILSEIEVGKGDQINFSELVICFDDLERLSRNLNLEEFIGFVNSLVENESIKIIIIANENKIEQNNYSLLKEKVVGNSIEFIPDTSKSFDSLIDIKFSSFKHYKDFLKENKSIIIDIYSKYSLNLRILSFALNYYHRVFSEVENNILSIEILKDKKDEILLSLLKFSLAISIEYKEGRITFNNRDQLYVRDFNLSDFENIQFKFDNRQNKEEVKTYRQKFVEKYYPDTLFTFFTSIFNFITGGSIIQFNELVIELKKLYHIQDDVIPMHYEVFNQLNYPKVFSLSDKEYKKLTFQMLRYSDKGLYDLSEYLTVFSFSVRFNNPCKFKLDQLEKRIIDGMKKGKLNYNFQSSLDFYLQVDIKSQNIERLQRIRSVALGINKEICIVSTKVDSKRLEDICYKDFEGFCDGVLKRDSQYSYMSIFNTFNANKFYQFFLKADGKLQWEILNFWSSRYGQYPHSALKEEIIFLQMLKNKLSIKLNQLPDYGLINFMFKEHVSVLEVYIDRLNRLS